MAQHLERKKVTEHAFPLSPARHTHTYRVKGDQPNILHPRTLLKFVYATVLKTCRLHLHTNTGPPCRAVCARWGCDTWLLSLLPSLHRQLSNCTTIYCSQKIQWNTTWGTKQCHLLCTQGGIKRWQRLKSTGWPELCHKVCNVSLWTWAELNTRN